VRPTQPLNRRRGQRIAAAAIGFALIAAACSDKKDDEAVGGGDDTTATEETDAPVDTTAPADTASEGEGTATTTGGTDAPGTTEAPDPGEITGVEIATLPAPEMDPVYGGRLVVAGEAEVGAPWTPEAVQCDSYCQMRIRTFFEPLFTPDQNLQVQGHLGESITPNEDATVWTIKVREGISFTDGTPLNADAVIDNLNRTFGGILVSGALKDTAKNPDGTLVTEKIDDYTFTIAMGKNGDVSQPVSWWRFPYFLTAQAGFIASPTWLAAVDGNPDLATQPVGTGPFMVQSYLPGDRMTVVRNPDYWRTDENGDQLPYLDEIEFRVIPDSQVRQQALESGDVDLIATSDPTVVGPLSEDSNFVTLKQEVLTETGYIMFHLTQPQFQDRDVRCALLQAVDRQDVIDTVYAGYAEPATGPFTPGQDGFLDDAGLPEYDPDAARAAIEAWEAENGPLEIPFSTTPTGTNKALADYLQVKWGDVGVDMTQDTIEQSAIITNALLGTPEFYAFAWRNHAGLFAESQTHWWHGFASDAFGAETADGALSLNFGRLNDPVINDLLDQARVTEDAEESKAIAQDINRQFASECWIMPILQTVWGIHMQPNVQNISRDPLPDGGFMADGAGFPGQVWLGAAFLSG
jgi:ABC-type transport system substrate-binding protein